MALRLTQIGRTFDFNAFFQGVQGNEIYRLYRRGNVTFGNWDKTWLNRWHGEGTSNWMPQIVEGGQNGTNDVFNLYVEDGSYFSQCLKVLQLGLHLA